MSKVHVLVTLAALLLPTALAAVASPTQSSPYAAAPWRAWNVVDLQVPEYDNPSLALDSHGFAHIVSWFDNGGTPQDGVHLVEQGANGWTDTIIDPSGRTASIAIGPDDVKHVAVWQFKTNGQYDGSLHYFRIDSTGAHEEVADASPTAGERNVIRLDPQGFPHIFYSFDWGVTHSLKHAWKDASGWHTETVESGSGVFQAWLGFAIDKQGGLHAAYGTDEVDSFWGSTWYDYKPLGGSWSRQFVDVGGSEEGLALDSSGAPGISYDGVGEVLRYAHLENGQWVTETVDSNAPTARGTSIAFDSHNHPHITYYQVDRSTGNPLFGHLQYATKLDDGTWDIETPDPQGQALDTSILIDARDRPRIAYIHIADQVVSVRGYYVLMYAEPGAATFEAMAAHPSAPNRGPI